MQPVNEGSKYEIKTDLFITYSSIKITATILAWSCLIWLFIITLKQEFAP
jgi:hypothetical protein